MIRLVLNADDLGLAPALTRRVLELRACGHVSDVSVLAGGRAATEALDGLLARRVAAAGVHLSLVGGDRPSAPAEKVPSLLTNGVFRGHWSRVLAALTSGRIRTAEVEREWEAQVARVAASGLTISHLDSHQHLHLHPVLFPIAVRIAKAFGVPFLRAPRAEDPATAAVGSPAVRARARLLALLGGRGRALLEEVGLREPPRVLGLAEAGRMTEKCLVRLVGTLPSGDYEVVLHPGEEDDVTADAYRWGYAWREESDALASPAVAAAVRAAGARVVSFAELAN